MRNRLVAALKRINTVRGELLTALALLAGWYFLTRAIVALTAPLAWTVSIGLLCISLGGWKMLWTIATTGLYALTKGR